jgi:hypothetical protein
MNSKQERCPVRLRMLRGAAVRDPPAHAATGESLTTRSKGPKRDG